MGTHQNTFDNLREWVRLEGGLQTGSKKEDSNSGPSSAKVPTLKEEVIDTFKFLVAVGVGAKVNSPDLCLPMGKEPMIQQAP